MSSSTAVLTDQSPAEIDAQLFPILERIDVLQGRIASGNKSLETMPDWQAQLSHLTSTVVLDEERLTRKEAEAAPLEAEYTRRGGWDRYIVVPGGHLHKRSCHTLTPGRTMVGQVADASGLNEAAVVAKYDETACSHCFPNAPVAPAQTPEQEGFCKGSGRVLSPEALDKIDWKRRRSVSIRCSDCGKGVSLTERGALRKHKAAS